MGASREVFEDMREREYTVNMTFKVQGYDELKHWEDELRDLEGLKVIDFKTLQDTKELKNKDSKFRRLLKVKKDAGIACEIYINKHN